MIIFSGISRLAHANDDSIGRPTLAAECRSLKLTEQTLQAGKVNKVSLLILWLPYGQQDRLCCHYLALDRLKTSTPLPHEAVSRSKTDRRQRSMPTSRSRFASPRGTPERRSIIPQTQARAPERFSLRPSPLCQTAASRQRQLHCPESPSPAGSPHRRQMHHSAQFVYCHSTICQ